MNAIDFPGDRRWPEARKRPIVGSCACCLLLLLLVLPRLAWPAPPLVLSDQRQKYNLGPFLEILADAGGTLRLADVLKPENQSRFAPAGRPVPSFGFTRTVYWVRFEVINEASSRSPWALQLANPNMDFVDMHLLAADGTSTMAKESGRMRRLEPGDYNDQNPVFLVPLPRSHVQKIYMRFQTEESMIIPIVLWSMTGFVAHVGEAHLAAGLFLGILLIMIFYNLFLYISLKDRNYLYFVLCIAAIFCFTLSFRGIGYVYLWPGAMAFNRLVLPVSSGLLVLSLLKFSETFLAVRKNMAGLYRFFVLLMAATAGLIVSTPFVSYQAVIRPIVVAGICGSALMLATAGASFMKGYKPARYLLLGFSMLGLGGIGFLLVRIGLLPSTHITDRGFDAGNIVVILMMALALADRIKLMRLEGEQSMVSLRESEEQVRILSRATEQSPALIIITDLNGRIEYVNSRFSEVTGYSLAEIRGRNPRLLKSGNTPAAVYRELWAAITSGEAWRGELHNKKKNGDLYWQNAFICPIKNETGATTHYLALMEDVTEHRELQEQFFQIQKLESIGTLAGGIAHDFNNILTVIRGHADLALARLGKRDPVQANLTVIRSAGEKAENLIRQILAFSRKQIYLPQLVNLNQVIGDIKDMLMHLIGEDIRVEMVLADSDLSISADPSQIEQIFINLVVNARDAINEKTTRAAEKKITVETGTAWLDGDYVKSHAGARQGLHAFFSISDTGTGIAEENRKKIFEPFFSTKQKGAGLGLATVYGIVKQNDANIFLYSEAGKGTTFKVYWPAAHGKAPVADKTRLDPRELHGQAKVLLAEDDADVADFAAAALREAGYEVVVARDGQQALALVAENGCRPDLLMTDLIMPGMNGKELAERVREKLPKIRVLFSSGYTDNHLVHNGQLDARIDFLQKPYALVDLLKKVRDVLHKK